MGMNEHGHGHGHGHGQWVKTSGVMREFNEVIS